MQDYLEFVYLADKDYLAARLLNFCGRSLFSQAAYHSQQCVEKYLKALLLQKGEPFPKEHKLEKLSSLCEKHYEGLFDKKTVNLLKKFDIPEQVSRYGSFASFDPLSKKVEGKFETRGVFVWQDTDIKDLDMLVYKLRGQILFGENVACDNLQAILKGNEKNILAGGWRLKFFSIKDVLISHNDFLKL